MSMVPLLFSHNFYRKNCLGISGIRTRIVGVEGKHTDHLTTPTVFLRLKLLATVSYSNLVVCFATLRRLDLASKKSVQEFS